MITMVIIAIISAAILGTASAAMENARRSRTQTVVTRISGLIMERWDSYANRRVDINPAILTQIETWANDPSLTPQERSQRNVARGQMLADARLLALRELMKLEMPDRWSDVLTPPAILAAPPPLALNYERLYNDIGSDADDDNQIAECLYMTVMYATGDGEARTLFSSQDIADTDGDGAAEFIDGWGRPIQWIRWPAGFVSELQPADDRGNRRLEDHDPFDIYNRDSPESLLPPSPDISLYPMGDLKTLVGLMRDRNKNVAPGASQLAAFRLVPLIFSSGGDQVADYLVHDFENPTPVDPYALTDDIEIQGGDHPSDSDAWRDNIHNHLIDY